jgi:cell division protein ZapA
MAEPEVVKIRLFGTDYDVASTEDVDYTREIGRFVDEKMHEVAKQVSLRSVSTIAVLAAVNMADELRKERETKGRIDEAVSISADRLATLIDETPVHRS